LDTAPGGVENIVSVTEICRN